MNERNPVFFRAATSLMALCLLASLAAVPTHAAPEGDTRVVRTAEDDELLDARIDIKLAKARAEDLFRTFAKIAGLKPDVDPAVQGEVSLVLENVRLETALNAACETAGCRWRIAGGALRIEPLPGGAGKAQGTGKEKESALDARIDLKVSQADAHDLLETFAQLLGARLDLDPAVTGKVSLSLEDTSCRDGLDAVCKQAGCTWTLGEGEKPVLKVAKR